MFSLYRFLERFSVEPEEKVERLARSMLFGTLLFQAATACLTGSPMPPSVAFLATCLNAKTYEIERAVKKLRFEPTIRVKLRSAHRESLRAVINKDKSEAKRSLVTLSQLKRSTSSYERAAGRPVNVVSIIPKGRDVRLIPNPAAIPADPADWSMFLPGSVYMNGTIACRFRDEALELATLGVEDIKVKLQTFNFRRALALHYSELDSEYGKLISLTPWLREQITDMNEKS